MVCIQVPKKGIFTCNKRTAGEALEYLREVSLGCLSSGWSSSIRRLSGSKPTALEKSGSAVKEVRHFESPTFSKCHPCANPGWMSPGMATCCCLAARTSWKTNSSCMSSVPILCLGRSTMLGWDCMARVATVDVHSPACFGVAVVIYRFFYN